MKLNIFHQFSTCSIEIALYDVYFDDLMFRFSFRAWNKVLAKVSKLGNKSERGAVISPPDFIIYIIKFHERWLKVLWPRGNIHWPSYTVSVIYCRRGFKPNGRKIIFFFQSFGRFNQFTERVHTINNSYYFISFFESFFFPNVRLH